MYLLYNYEIFVLRIFPETDQYYQKEEETLQTQRAGEFDGFPIIGVTKHHLLKINERLVLPS